jgi:hypothetical protein
MLSDYANIVKEIKSYQRTNPLEKWISSECD